MFECKETGYPCTSKWMQTIWKDILWKKTHNKFLGLLVVDAFFNTDGLYTTYKVKILKSYQ